MQPQTPSTSVDATGSGSTHATTVELNVPDASTKLCTVDSQSCSTIGCSINTTIASTTLPAPPKSVQIRVAGENALQITIVPTIDDGGANVTYYVLKRLLASAWIPSYDTQFTNENRWIKDRGQFITPGKKTMEQFDQVGLECESSSTKLNRDLFFNQPLTFLNEII